MMYVPRSTFASHSGDDSEQRKTDAEVISSLETLARYIFVILAHICFAIRVTVKSPLLFRRLLFVTKGGAKSCFDAVRDGILWLNVVSNGGSQGVLL